MTNLEKAREMLKSGSFGKCILYSSEIIHTSSGQGIKPMLEFLIAGLDVRGFSAADTVAGRALALLLAYAGIKEIYADVMSHTAVSVFERHEIRYVYGELTDMIKNRAGDDLCPMEKAVFNINEPEEAFRILKTMAGL
jgi:hypothetical protein